jgi:hypothetical protein
VRVFLEEERVELIALKEHKSHLLEINEMNWILKIRAIWLEEGDSNSNFVQNFMAHRKFINTIWDLDGLDGSKIRTFRELSRPGEVYFEDLLREPNERHIVEKMRIIRPFPQLFNQELNDKIEALILKDELKHVLSRFKK